MTSANVTNILQSPGQMMTAVDKSDGSYDEAFAKLVDQAISASVADGGAQKSSLSQSEELMTKAAPEEKSRPVTSSDKTESYEKEQSRPNVHHEKISSNSQVSEKEGDLEQADALNGAITKLKEKIAEIIKDNLNVTDEELQAVMEVLGITLLDLQDPSKLAMLMNQLSGEDNAVNILMSTEFADVFNELQTLFKDFSIEMDMTAAKAQEILSQMIPVSEEEAKEILSKLTDTESILDIESTDTANAKDIPAQTSNTVSVVTEVKDDGSIEEIEAGEAGEVKVTVTKTAESQNSFDFSEDESQEFTQEKANASDREAATAAINVSAQTDMVREALPEINPQETYTGQIDVQSVIDQIVERTTTSIAADSSQTIEMLLNPESYGKLILHVTADKAGNITAQIITQNVEVKEALESQMAILRENLGTNQGNKVEAIEVTVSSHAFEENLEKDAARDERNTPEDNKQHGDRKMRNLNLNSLDDLQGLMTEEEQLAAQIMRDQGNSVNLTA